MNSKYINIFHFLNMKQLYFFAAICCVIAFCSCESKKEYESYQEACRDNDFDAAHVFIDDLFNTYQETVTEETDFDGSSGEKIKAAASNYCLAANYVYSRELRFLANLNEDAAWDRALYLVKEMDVVGRKYPKDKENIWPDGSCYFIECYQEYVELRNRQCDELLELAIDNKNQSIAEKVLRCFCENCKTTDDIPSLVYYVNDDIRAAQMKYDEAVKSGAFD